LLGRRVRIKLSAPLTLLSPPRAGDPGLCMLQAQHCSRTLLPPHIHPLSGEEVTQGGEKEKKGGRFCEKQGSKSMKARND